MGEVVGGLGLTFGFYMGQSLGFACVESSKHVERVKPFSLLQALPFSPRLFLLALFFADCPLFVLICRLTESIAQANPNLYH